MWLCLHGRNFGLKSGEDQARDTKVAEDWDSEGDEWSGEWEEGTLAVFTTGHNQYHTAMGVSLHSTL